jgi:hypothetical protein
MRLTDQTIQPVQLRETPIVRSAIPFDKATPTPGSTEAIRREDVADPSHWLARGILVGLALGGSVGSIIPFLGTGIGAFVGCIAGLAIGTLMTLFAAVTRHGSQSSPKEIEWRERSACLGIIWVGTWVLLAKGAGALVLIPAVLGSIHAMAAGTPTREKTYAGDVSEFRKRVCYRLPVAILAIIATGWIIAMVRVAGE